MNEQIKNNIIEKLQNGEEISPILFTGQNLELLNSKVFALANEILDFFSVPKVNIFKLENNWESIKIEKIKEFLTFSKLITPYKVQIFIIEDISKMTLQTANSCLKIFEEPMKRNLFFLTNVWDSSVLETILSRVTVIETSFKTKEIENMFFISLIDNFVKKNNFEIFSYFFSSKLEKNEYINFLLNLIVYSRKNLLFSSEILQSIDKDIYLIEKNNVNPKWIIDKYLLKLTK